MTGPVQSWNVMITENLCGERNMALDEAAFQLSINGTAARPVLRIYTWQSPCISIGYFQKYAEHAHNQLPVIRRFTGGLAVLHGHDIAYSLVVSQDHLSWIRSQHETNRVI